LSLFQEFKHKAPSWYLFLNSPEIRNSFEQLEKFLTAQLKAQKVVYPARDNYFAALEKTPLEKVKVIILGQDPYHGEGQAQGLSFSVPENYPLPPSLKNIFKELVSDMACSAPTHGSLEHWASVGVLLLNTVLTVEKNKPASHAGKGWESITDEIIKTVSAEIPHCVFILWGSPAQKKKKLIDTKKHLVLESVHPSPLSSYRGFFGSKPFSTANKYLEKYQIAPIKWA
jgi:uracil-DNA glycosylase